MLFSDHMLFDGADRAGLVLVLAHGAGAPMDSPFMAAYAKGLAGHDVRVARFEFPFMRRRRAEGTRRPPDRGPKLEAAWRHVVAEMRDLSPQGAKLVIGGKSIGGRIASLLAHVPPQDCANSIANPGSASS